MPSTTKLDFDKIECFAMPVTHTGQGFINYKLYDIRHYNIVKIKRVIRRVGTSPRRPASHENIP